MARIIQMLRGLKKDLPKLKPGQIALTIDEHKLYVGSDDSANHGVSMDGHTHDPVSVGGIPIVTTYTPEGGTEGADYAADIPGVEALYAGLLICIMPHIASSSDTLRLTCAGSKKSIKRPAALTMATALHIAGAPLKGTRLFTINRPCLLMYNGTAWLAVSYPITQLDAVIGTLSVTYGGTGGTTAEVARENLGAAAKSSMVTATLTAAGWSGSGPYTQTLSVAGLTADGNGSIGLAQTATAAEREAARDAMLSVTGQAAGTLTVTADGDKPTVDIPVTVTVIG